MKKITLHFQSNIKDIYTTEIETAEDDRPDLKISWTDGKVSRMLDKWFYILCPHIKFDRYMSEMQLQHKVLPQPYQLEYGEQQKLYIEWQMKLIENHLNVVNDLNKEKIESGEENKRTFEIKVEDVEKL